MNYLDIILSIQENRHASQSRAPTALDLLGA